MGRAVRRLTGALVGLALLALGAGGAAAQGTDLTFPADQFDRASYQPRQSVGDARYESILQDIRAANFEPLSLLAADDPVRRLAEPVGLLKVLLGDHYITCTASIIDAALILTNWHCLPMHGRRVTKAALWMGYYGDDERGVERFEVDVSPVESGNADLDYAILRVKGDVSRWGRVTLSTDDPPANRSLSVVHHPAGRPKHLTQRSCRTADPPMAPGGLRHKCDTVPGSSGAPVFYGLGENARVVALHYSGVPQSLLGIDPGVEANRAVPMSRIGAASAVVRRLTEAGRAPAPSTTSAGAQAQRAQPGSTAVPEARPVSPPPSRPSAAELSRLVSSGQAAYERKDYAAAVRDWTAACDGGDAEGCFGLGLLYRYGQGFARENPVKARELYRKACDGGHARACNNLGALHLLGAGGAKDPKKARELFQKACNGGFELSCCNLEDPLLICDMRGR